MLPALIQDQLQSYYDLHLEHHVNDFLITDDGAEDLEWRRTDEGEDAPRGSKKRRDSGEGEEGRANTKERKKKRAKKERVVEF